MLKDIILKARRKLNLTQEKFSKRMGVSRQYITNLELGKELPSDDFLIKLARLTKTTHKELQEQLKLRSEEKAEIEYKKSIQKLELEPKLKIAEPIISPDKDIQDILSKYPEIPEALKDPVAIKVLLSVHKGDENIKKACRVMLNLLPNLSKKKQQAILSLLEGLE